MASPATPCAAPPLKVEEPEAATAQAAVPAEKIGKGAPVRAKTTASVAASKPVANGRVRKPAAKTPTGTKIRSKKLRLIAEAENIAATASATNNNSNNGDNGDNGDNKNSSSSSSSNSNSSSNNSSNNSSNSNSNNISNKRNNRGQESEGTSPTRATSGKHTPPPLPADDVFAKLPDDANPIDRAIFAQLALVWNEDAERWTEAMRRSFLDILPRARVTKSTATLGNQYVCRMVRENYAESGAIPTWGQFVVIRSMLGPAVCFRFKWAADFVKRYPLAREDSYEGVVPSQRQVVKDVMEGKAGMPLARNRKEGIMQLGRERTRRTKPRAAGVKKERSEVGAAFSADLKTEAEGEDETVKVDEDVWNEVAASAGRMDPAMWLAKQRRMYADKQALVMELQEDMRDIRKSLEAFKRMADVVMEG